MWDHSHITGFSSVGRASDCSSQREPPQKGFHGYQIVTGSIPVIRIKGTLDSLNPLFFLIIIYNEFQRFRL